MKQKVASFFYFLLMTGMLYGIKKEKSMPDVNTYFVILAGGNGERLWPLSRKDKPKQLLEVGNDQTLLEQAIARVIPLAQSKDNIWVVTTQNHANEIKKCVGDTVGTILAEPVGRNTGPAILYSCFEIYKKNPEARVVFLPADPFIPICDNKKFSTYLADAINFVAKHKKIALLGVKPTFAATGYGYVEYDAVANHDATGLYRVKNFHEKPELEYAQEYIKQETMLWNIGMFCCKASVFIDEFKKCAPELFYAVDAFVKNEMPYEDIPSEPVDCAVMERSEHVWIKPVDFSWCDVGNIGTFLALKQEHTGLNNNLIVVDSNNNFVDVPDKLVALVGVDDLCIVQTEDALLITRFDQAEKVRAIVNQLKKRNDTRHL